MKTNTDIEGRFDMDTRTGCWLWTAYRNRGGYGKARHGGKVHLAHRVSWEVHNGPIPAGMCVCHRCDTPSCVNPEHLFLGTQADNVRDMAAKGRGRAPAGEAHRSAKLTAADVAAIRADGRTPRIIAAEYGVSRPQISAIRLGKNWRNAA